MDEKIFPDVDEIKTLSPIVSAYIGDAYFHLYVRTRLLKTSHNIKKLHEMSAEIVSAVSQAKAYAAIEENLTDEEKIFFKRGRNAKTHSPKNSTIAEYHSSTGFENLLGELFLRKNFSRLDEICEMAFHVTFDEKNF